MAYRIFEDDRLGPHIAGEPNAKLAASATVRNCLGEPWVPKSERTPDVIAADASVEKKLADPATKPVGVYVNAGKRHAEHHEKKGGK